MAVAGRVLIMPKGAYNSSETYQMLDLVSHGGTSWLAKKPVKGITPSDANSAYWFNMFNADIDAILEELGVHAGKLMSNFGRVENLNIDDLSMVGGSKQGRYFIETAKTEGTHPEEGHYMLLNFPYIQIAVIGTSTVMYVRMYTNDKWYPWTKFVREKDTKTKVVSTPNTNLNDYREEGRYYFNSEVTPTNIPVGVNGFLIVISAGTNNNIVKQIWMRQGTQNSNDSDTYIRTYNDVNWSDWKKVAMA